MILFIRQLLYMFQEERKPRKPRDGPGDKCDQIAFTNTGIVCTFLDEFSIRGVLLQFFPVYGLRERVMLDVVLVVRLTSQNG